MRALANLNTRATPKAQLHGMILAPLLSQVRLAMIAGVDREFVQNAELKKLDVTAAQFVILKNVEKGSAESACELCKLLDYDRGAMSRMIDRLETRGLVRRVPLAHTRRSVALELTDLGRSALPIMEDCLERVVSRLLKGIPKAEVRETERVLQRMLENA